MRRITNNHGVGLPLAVWLATDGYSSGSDVAPEGELISATTLLKPTRQFILSQRVPESENTIDVMDLVKARMGHSFHDSIENAWVNNYVQAMKDLGYPQKVIDMVRINPEKVEEDTIPVFTEQRRFKEFDGVIITGQLDLSINGELDDTKSTSVWNWIKGSKDEDYILQGSIYRWLFQDVITTDLFRIQFIFTDYQKSMAKHTKDYPPKMLMEKTFKLLSIQETEAFIRNKLAEIRKNVRLPQSEMIRCTDEELWRSDPVWKYYSNPETAKKGGKASKNFDNAQDAQLHMSKAGKGVVVLVPGKVKACGYCPAFPICEQAKEYEHD